MKELEPQKGGDNHFISRQKGGSKGIEASKMHEIEGVKDNSQQQAADAFDPELDAGGR